MLFDRSKDRRESDQPPFQLLTLYSPSLYEIDEIPFIVIIKNIAIILPQAETKYQNIPSINLCSLCCAFLLIIGRVDNAIENNIVKKHPSRNGPNSVVCQLWSQNTIPLKYELTILSPHNNHEHHLYSKTKKIIFNETTSCVWVQL